MSKIHCPSSILSKNANPMSMNTSLSLPSANIDIKGDDIVAENYADVYPLLGEITVQVG